VITIPLEASDSEADLLRDFYAYITEGKEPGISVGKNLETMGACEMVVRAIEQGRKCRRGELAEL
jgi:hypothetical protein